MEDERGDLIEAGGDESAEIANGVDAANAYEEACVAQEEREASAWARGK